MVLPVSFQIFLLVQSKGNQPSFQSVDKLPESFFFLFFLVTQVKSGQPMKKLTCAWENSVSMDTLRLVNHGSGCGIIAGNANQ